jgi:hypothetical protein
MLVFLRFYGPAAAGFLPVGTLARGKTQRQTQ